MIKKLLFILCALGGYSYLIFSGEEDLWLMRAKQLYHYGVTQIQGKDLEVHVNKGYNDLPIKKEKPEIKFKERYKSKRRISYRY